MSAPAWAVVVATLFSVLLLTAGWRWRVRTRRELSRQEKLAAARKAARGLRRTARRAGPGLEDPTSTRLSGAWSSVLGIGSAGYGDGYGGGGSDCGGDTGGGGDCGSW